MMPDRSLDDILARIAVLRSDTEARIAALGTRDATVTEVAAPVLRDEPAAPEVVAAPPAPTPVSIPPVLPTRPARPARPARQARQARRAAARRGPRRPVGVGLRAAIARVVRVVGPSLAAARVGATRIRGGATRALEDLRIRGGRASTMLAAVVGRLVRDLSRALAGGAGAVALALTRATDTVVRAARDALRAALRAATTAAGAGTRAARTAGAATTGAASTALALTGEVAARASDRARRSLAAARPVLAALVPALAALGRALVASARTSAAAIGRVPTRAAAAGLAVVVVGGAVSLALRAADEPAAVPGAPGADIPASDEAVAPILPPAAPGPDVATGPTTSEAPATDGEAEQAPGPDVAGTVPVAVRRPPALLRIPAIGVAAPTVAVGLEPDGAMEIPVDVSTVGWYEPGEGVGVAPGQIGTAVLAGHVDSRTQGAGAFYHLRDLAVGDEVVVEHADGTSSSWRVTEVIQYPKDELPIDEVFVWDGPPRLALITCGGAFDWTVRSYTDNIVVHAEPVVEAPERPTAVAS